jgi:hypothetical protein
VVAVEVYVEGGGDSVAQRKPWRVALGKWIEAAVPAAAGKVKVHPCGGRRNAFERFCEGRPPPGATRILLVDSEAPVIAATRWQHVKQRPGDGWDQPLDATEEHLHIMVEAVEHWLCADPEGLEAYFGAGFKRTKLPQRPDLELEPKVDALAKLVAASTGSRRGAYDKGRHLDLLGALSPARIEERCPSARAFLAVVRKRVSS